MNFGERLKNLRELNNVKQDELAALIDVSRSAISGYETKGKQPDFEKLIIIAKHFHVSIDYLILGETLETTKNYSYLNLYNSLSSKSQEELLRYIKYLKMIDGNHPGLK